MAKKVSNQISLNPFRLLAETVVEFKNHFLKLLLISAVVAIPGALLRIISFDNGVTDFSVVASVASLYASLALFYAFYNATELNKNSWAKIYVRASGRFLPFLGTTILLSLVALFAVLGFLLPVLFLADIVSIFFGIFGIVLGLVATWLLIRLSLAAIITATTEFGVLTSLRASWLGSKKRMWMLLFDWIVLAAILVLVSGIILRIFYSIAALSTNQVALALVSGVLAAVLLPVTIGFGVKLWQRIEKS